MRIIDSHTHILNALPEKLLEMSGRYGYEKTCVLGLQMEDHLNNLQCLYAKAIGQERVYAYGHLHYGAGIALTSAVILRQLQLMIGAGFDGWKILESKPEDAARLGLFIDDPIFEGAFAWAEKEQIPITWHSGDPATFWDEEKAPQFAIENNWLYLDKKFPSLQSLYKHTENVLERHPCLRVTLAHLYFTSDDMAHAERMLNTYDNLYLDLTPGSEMYKDFMAQPDEWREFFYRWKDRLIYGTDMVDSEDDIVFGSQDKIVQLIRSTLFSDQPFTLAHFSGVGLGLDEDVSKPILADNFEQIVGETPKPISKDGVNEYAGWLFDHMPEQERVEAKKLLTGIGR